MFDDLPVGYFETSEYPMDNGEYKYMAFRGFGHYEMQMKLKELGKACCFYKSDEQVVWFGVLSSNQGYLTLTNFRSEIS